VLEEEEGTVSSHSPGLKQERRDRDDRVKARFDGPRDDSAAIIIYLAHSLRSRSSR